ncbi:MAG: MBL fold metallo-hydrolase [Bacillota bacterium]|nr:MBL fold metallo-hydrolase [Bacillota bacterium]
MKITLIRHATSLINIGGTKFLLDPIFYSKGTLSPANGGKMVNNPLVDIDFKNDTLNSIDAILVTHPHRDHLDEKVLEIYGPDVEIICPSFYKDKISELGFKKVLPIEASLQYKDINIKLTKARHGIGEIEKLMGESFGFVLNSSNNENLYITGDTVWCTEIEEVLNTEKPEHIIAYAGNAVLNGNKITMGKEDIGEILTHTEKSIILPIHLEAWNHCILERKELKDMDDKIIVLKDGESIEFNQM